MPDYFYTAKNIDGKTETGNMMANNVQQVAKNLKSSGLVLIDALEVGKKKKSWFNFSFQISGNPFVEKMILVKNLWIMIAAGLSFVKSFEILSAQIRNKKLKKAVIDIKEGVNKGESLFQSMSRHPSMFSDLFVNMIKAGEESGTLDESLKILSEQMEKEKRLKSVIRNAMIYPIIIICIMLGVGLVAIFFIIPRLTTFFESLNVQLPIYTRIMIGSGKLITENWFVFILSLIALIAGLAFFFRSKKTKKIRDTLVLRLPVISPLVKKSNCTNLTRTLSSLISAGVPLIKALEISSGVVGNFYFQEAIKDTLEKVKKGEKLSASFKHYDNLFPFGAAEMIEVGEETGKTSYILQKLADFYEEETIAASKNLSVAIEPILIVIMGLAVGVFAISIIEPMYSAMNVI